MTRAMLDEIDRLRAIERAARIIVDHWPGNVMCDCPRCTDRVVNLRTALGIYNRAKEGKR